MTRSTVLQLSVFFLILILCIGSSAAKSSEPPESSESDESSEGNDIVSVPSCCGFSTPLLIKKDQWKTIFETVYGHISTIQIGDGCGGMGPYKLHSITLEPNALLLPLLLHSDMVFFVDSGSGILNWVDLEKKSTEIKRGDVYRLLPGTVFYLQSKPVDIFLGTKLRLYAIFSNNEECLHDPCFGAYSSITDLLFGFDGTILKSAFGVPEDIIGLLNNRTKPPLIVHDMLTTTNEDNTETWQIQPRLLKLFTGDVNADSVMGLAENKKKKKEKKEKPPKPKKAKTFNVFESDPDFESPNGRSVTINRNDLKVLRGSMVGVSMVNLTQGSMMGPHWNPWACEISIVLKGSGMVRVLRSSISSSSSECKNMRFKVEEGDIFAVPRLHPMAQMSFDNDSLVFVGFTTSAKDNEPQILAGKNSALWLLDRGVLALSFNVSSVMIDGLLGAQKEAAMLDCPNCAEGELEKLKVEMETDKREDERKKEEEEAKKEAEERKKREEEEEKKQTPPQAQQPPQPPQEEPQEAQPWMENMRYDNKKKSEKKKKKKEEKKKHEDEEKKKKKEEKKKHEDEEKKKKKPSQPHWLGGEEGENVERML